MKDNEKILIYFADLVHNFLGAGTYMFPLNIGFISSYAKKEFGEDIQIELFKYPDEFLQAVKKKKPHIIALSNYTWNSHLNHKVTEFCKKNFPDILTTCGGPDINLNPEGYRDFFKTHPYVDIYVLCEGEIGFSNIIRRYIDSGCDIAKTKLHSIEGCTTNGQEGIIMGNLIDRIKDVDSIPSPFLTGVLDKFFSYKLIPLIETNRGCPFWCIYCAQGLTSRHIVRYFDIKRVYAELEYIAKRTKNTNILEVVDANFGIHPRDVEISKKIHDLRESYGYPRHCIIFWVKNKQALKVAEVLGESERLVLSLQSLDPDVLTIIKRNNIDQSHFIDIINQVNMKGGISATEIILALPGETKESHTRSLRRLFDLDVSYILCYNCLLLNGSELTTQEYRDRYQIKTKFRLVDSSFGKYEDFVSFEYEEGVRSTSTMTEEEILFFRPVHWLIQFLWNYHVHYPILKFCQVRGMNPYDFIIALLEQADQAPEPVSRIFRDFNEEAHNEWFNSPEDMRNYFTKNFSILEKGEIGKMNSKYIFKVILECKLLFDDYVKQVAIDLFPDDRSLIEDIIEYSTQNLIDFTCDIENIRPKELHFAHDINSWQKQGYSTEIPQTDIRYIFDLPDEKQKALKILLNQYAHENKNVTLRKMSEHISFNDLYFTVSPAS